MLHVRHYLDADHGSLGKPPVRPGHLPLRSNRREIYVLHVVSAQPEQLLLTTLIHAINFLYNCHGGTQGCGL